MAQPGDSLVLYLLIGVIFYFILRKWMSVSPFSGRFKKSSKEEEEKIQGPIPDLLRRHGFEVVQSKVRVPLTFDVEEKTFESRLIVDYIARADDEIYLVIVARERKPLRITGPGLRDLLLPYFLLYRPEGILYVDPEKNSIKCIQMDVPNVMPEEKSGFHWFYITAALLGLVMIWLVQ